MPPDVAQSSGSGRSVLSTLDRRVCADVRWRLSAYLTSNLIPGRVLTRRRCGRSFITTGIYFDPGRGPQLNKVSRLKKPGLKGSSIWVFRDEVVLQLS